MKEEYKEYYIYLEKLRQSGATNMFGAGPYLQRAFGLSSKDADEILCNWMKNYDAIADKYYGGLK